MYSLVFMWMIPRKIRILVIPNVPRIWHVFSLPLRTNSEKWPVDTRRSSRSRRLRKRQPKWRNSRDTDWATKWKPPRRRSCSPVRCVNRRCPTPRPTSSTSKTNIPSRNCQLSWRKFNRDRTGECWWLVGGRSRCRSVDTTQLQQRMVAERDTETNKHTHNKGTDAEPR